MSWKKKFVRNWGRLGMKFNRYALSDLATIKYGKNQKKVLSESGNIPIYGTGGLMGYATTALYDKPSVLIGRKGTIGKVKYVEHPFWTVDTLFYTIINTDIVLPKYLYYVMSLIDLNNYNEGTTIPSLRTETLNRLEFDIPSLVEQETILSCLNPIDEKIALNNAINNNLEQQAMAIFNNAIEQSKSVTYVELGSLADVKGGKRLPKGANLMSIPNSHPYIRVRDLNDVVFASLSANYEYVDDETQKTISRYITTTDDVLISIVGTIGLTAIVDKSLNMANLTENCVKVTNLHGISPEYLLLYLRSQHGSEEIKKGTVGAVQAKLPIKNIQALSVPLLPQSDLQSLNDTLKVLFNQLSINVAESKCLTDIRDSLLPKLMSGELDVSNLDL